MASERRARQAHRRDQSRRFDTSTLAVRGYDLTFSYCRHRRIDRNNHGRQGGIALEDLSRAQSAGLKVLGELLAAECTLQLGEQGRTSAENQGCGLRGVDQLSRVAVPEKARDGCVGVKEFQLDNLAQTRIERCDARSEHFDARG